MAPYADPTKQFVAERFVRDLRRSTAFYRRLGFDVVGEKEAFVCLAWEGCQLFLDERRDLPPPSVPPVANVRVKVLDDDATWERAVEAGAQVVAPLADRDYGLRDFTILDPDGFGVRFGTWLAADRGRVAERSEVAEDLDPNVSP